MCVESGWSRGIGLRWEVVVAFVHEVGEELQQGECFEFGVVGWCWAGNEL